MKLNIVLDSSTISQLLQPTNVASMPSLSSLLGLADQVAVNDTVEAMLSACAGISKQADWPVAAISSLAEQWADASFSQHSPVSQQQDGYWLMVDAVHFVLQRDYFTLAALLDIPADESQVLLATLNRHFAEDGLTFLASADQRRWYLYLQDDPQMTTSSPRLVLGRDTTSFMPAGKGAAKWNRLLNEVQMLLFEHPVNQLREQRGELAVNSIWLSGGGRQPVSQQSGLYQTSMHPSSMHTSFLHSSSRQPHSLQVVGGGVFVQGLGMLKPPHVQCDQLVAQMPDAAMPVSLQSLLMPGMDEVWLMADAVNYSDALAIDWPGPDAQSPDAQSPDAQSQFTQTQVKQTRQELWFKSILTALRKARIEQVNVYIDWQGNHVCMSIRPADSWKFWRKPKPLADLLSVLAASY